MPTISVSRSFNAPAEQVFDAWLDPAIASQWLFRTPDGKVTVAEFDARVGGSFNLTERRAEGDAAHTGTYVELERPRRLVFDFDVEPYSKGATTRVSIDLSPTESGCELRLTHDGVWEEWEEKTRQGWETLLGNLAKVVE